MGKLTTILSTPRTGSTSLLRSVNSEIWFPDCHPGKITSEYFTFSKQGVYEDQVRKYFTFLESHVKNTDCDIVIKVIVPQLTSVPDIFEKVVGMSDIIYHTARKCYRSQLNSWIQSNKLLLWGRHRPAEGAIVLQEEIDRGHELLTNCIMQHATIYRRIGGQLFFLEDRKQDRYPNIPPAHDNLVWPDFDTEKQFMRY